MIIEPLDPFRSNGFAFGLVLALLFLLLLATVCYGTVNPTEKEREEEL